MVFFKHQTRNETGYHAMAPRGFGGITPNFEGKKWSVRADHAGSVYFNENPNGFDPVCKSPWGELTGSRALIFQHLKGETTWTNICRW